MWIIFILTKYKVDSYVRVWGMHRPNKGTFHYHAQLGLPDKSSTIKELSLRRLSVIN